MVGRRRGQSLAEFAIVSLVLYFLVAGLLTLGYAIYIAQGLQQASDLAAREISRTPLLPDQTLDDPTTGVLFGDANANPELNPGLAEVRERVFDEHYLVLIVDENHPDRYAGRDSLSNLIADLPVVNQQLFPLMISDFVNGIQVVRYPGRVFADSNPNDNPSDPPPSGFLVNIPTSSGGTIPVIEEIQSDSNPNPFQLFSSHRGIVALRINYPWHSPFTVGVQPNNDDPPNNVMLPAETTTGTNLSQGPLGNGFGPYVGENALGRVVASDGRGATQVRPYRKIISGQAIYRREVFAH